MSPLSSENGKDIAKIDALQQCNLINCVDQAGKNDSLHLFLKKLQLQPHNNDPGEVHATGKHFTDFKLKKVGKESSGIRSVLNISRYKELVSVGISVNRETVK